MEGNAAFVWLIAFALGLLMFLAWEIGQWRRAGAVLSGRQRMLRLTTIGLLAVVILLLGVSAAGLVHAAVPQLIVLTAILILTLVVMALALRDYRELKATRYTNEMKIAGDVARVIVAEIQRAKAEEAQAASQPDDSAN